MTSREFCYWLQGYFEITGVQSGNANLTADQIECVRKHLNMVFIHEIDPSYPKHQQPALNQAHGNDKVLMRC